MLLADLTLEFVTPIVNTPLYYTMQKYNLQKNPLKETKSFKIS
jgi:hypothetical protein